MHNVATACHVSLHSVCTRTDKEKRKSRPSTAAAAASPLKRYKPLTRSTRPKGRPAIPLVRSDGYVLSLPWNYNSMSNSRKSYQRRKLRKRIAETKLDDYITQCSSQLNVLKGGMKAEELNKFLANVDTMRAHVSLQPNFGQFMLPRMASGHSSSDFNQCLEMIVEEERRDVIAAAPTASQGNRNVYMLNDVI